MTGEGAEEATEEAGAEEVEEGVDEAAKGWEGEWVVWTCWWDDSSLRSRTPARTEGGDYSRIKAEVVALRGVQILISC